MGNGIRPHSEVHLSAARLNYVCLGYAFMPTRISILLALRLLRHIPRPLEETAPPLLCIIHSTLATF